MTASDRLCGVFHASLAVTPDAVPSRTRPVPGDLRNLLQIVASTLHLLDRQLDDELRPLVRIGLAAIGQACCHAHAAPPFSTLYLSLGESHG